MIALSGVRKSWLIEDSSAEAGHRRIEGVDNNLEHLATGEPTAGFDHSARESPGEVPHHEDPHHIAAALTLTRSLPLSCRPEPELELAASGSVGHG